MRLTIQELNAMQSVDIGAVAANMLPEVSDAALDRGLPCSERTARFLRHVANPYCFSVGGVGVKIEFAENGPSLQDALTGFFLRARSGL